MKGKNGQRDGSLFDPGKASLQTWVGRIARNCLLDHLRAVRPLEARPLPEEELETAKAPDTLLVEDEQLDLFMRAMRSLPKSYRKVIALLSEGKRPREIALILHCTPNAANIRCSRARKALRDRLKRE